MTIKCFEDVYRAKLTSKCDIEKMIQAPLYPPYPIRGSKYTKLKGVQHKDAQKAVLQATLSSAWSRKGHKV